MAHISCLSKLSIWKLITLDSECFQTKEAKDELQHLDFSLPRINKLIKAKSVVLFFNGFLYSVSNTARWIWWSYGGSLLATQVSWYENIDHFRWLIFIFKIIFNNTIRFNHIMNIFIFQLILEFNSNSIFFIFSGLNILLPWVTQLSKREKLHLGDSWSSSHVIGWLFLNQRN